VTVHSSVVQRWSSFRARWIIRPVCPGRNFTDS